MVGYGFVLILGAILRAIAKLLGAYGDGYGIHNMEEVTIHVSVYGWISLATIFISEIILIGAFSITIAKTHSWKLLIIVLPHLIYAVGTISYPFLKPYYIIRLYSYGYESYEMYFILDLIKNIGAILLLLMSDWFVYRLCDGDSYHNGLITGVSRNIPLGILTIRAVEFLIRVFGIGFLYYHLNTGFLIIPICWIILGLNLAPDSMFISNRKYT